MSRFSRILQLVVVTAAFALPLGAAPAAAAQPARTRVYVAPLVGATVDKAILDLVEDRILVATRAASRTHDVVGAADVQGILDAEAARQAVGCDTTSCQNEIADALAADELVTGQLGQIGDTWQLTLTRTERKTLQVLARVSVEARGSSPEGLLPGIDGQVRELFGAGPSALAVAGTATAVIGGAAVLVGGALYGLSWADYFAAEDALAEDDVRTALDKRDSGEGLLASGLVVGGVGLGVAVIGASLLVLDAMMGAE